MFTKIFRKIIDTRNGKRLEKIKKNRFRLKEPAVKNNYLIIIAPVPDVFKTFVPAEATVYEPPKFAPLVEG